MFCPDCKGKMKVLNTVAGVLFEHPEITYRKYTCTGCERTVVTIERIAEKGEEIEAKNALNKRWKLQHERREARHNQ